MRRGEMTHPPPPIEDSVQTAEHGNTKMLEGISCVWVDDREVMACPICHCTFTFFRRKHHCRLCGGVFCWYCSTTRVKVVVTNTFVEEFVRLCDICAKKALVHSTLTLEAFIPDHEIKAWNVLIHGYDRTNPENNVRLKEKIKTQEVPNMLRPLLWRALTDSCHAKNQSSHSYASLLNGRELDPTTRERMQQDLARAFSDERMTQIKCERTETSRVTLQHQIFNILQVFCLMFPKVKYEQGMSFIAGVFVLLTNEEDAFWMFVQLMRKFYVAGMYKTGTPVLNKCIKHFKAMVAHLFPDLNEHFEHEGITVEIFANQWFLTLYSHNFPLSYVLRIWDLFFCEGIDFIVTMALAIFSLQQDKLAKLSYMETMTFLSTLPSNMPHLRGYTNVALRMLAEME